MDMTTKTESDLLDQANAVYDEALRDCNAALAERAALLFEIVGADRMAARARNFAAALQKGTI